MRTEKFVFSFRRNSDQLLIYADTSAACQLFVTPLSTKVESGRASYLCSMHFGTCPFWNRSCSTGWISDPGGGSYVEGRSETFIRYSNSGRNSFGEFIRRKEAVLSRSQLLSRFAKCKRQGCARK